MTLATLTFARATIMDKPAFENDIPVPTRGGDFSKYYWLKEMEVGDSFTGSIEEYTALAQVTYSKRQKKGAAWLPDGFKIQRRKIGKDLHRIWRVA